MSEPVGGDDAATLGAMLLRQGRRRWMEAGSCESRGSFGWGGYRLDQGARVLLVSGEECGAQLEESVPRRLGALFVELCGRGAEPLALCNGIRIDQLGDPGAAETRDTIAGKLGEHAGALGLPVLAGEIAHVEGVVPAVSLFLLGRMSERFDLDGEPRGELGDTVFRVRLDIGGGVALAEAQLRLGRQLAEATAAGDLVFIGGCCDGALIAAADWVDSAGRGLRLQRARWGGAEVGLGASAPLDFLVAGSRLPEGIRGEAVGEITAGRALEILDSRGGVLQFAPEDLRRGGAAPPEDLSETEVRDLPIRDLPEPGDYAEVLLKMAATPALRSRRPIYERFSLPGTDVPLAHGGDAGAFAVGGRRDVLAASVDSAPRFSMLDPYIGACLAVAEATRNLTAVGAEPLGVAVTVPGENLAQAELVYDGLQHAASALGTTIELARAGQGDDLAPTVLAVGRPVARGFLTPWFHRSGDLVVVLGNSREEIGGSAFAAFHHGRREGMPPWVDLGAERRLQDLVRRCCREGLLRSAHDISAGGLALTLVEACCGAGDRAPLGVHVELAEGMRPDAWLFGESQARMLLSIGQEELASLREYSAQWGVPLEVIGTVGGDVLEAGSELRLPLEELKEVWEGPVGDRISEV